MEPSHRLSRFFRSLTYRVCRLIGLCRPVALVIEEDEDLTLFMGDQLRRAGFDVYHAFDGVAGLQKALALEPDLIVLDYLMPELDGMKVLRVLRSTPAGRHAKVILQSAAEPAAIAAGADAMLQKPYPASELVDLAYRLLGGAQA